MSIKKSSKSMSVCFRSSWFLGVVLKKFQMTGEWFWKQFWQGEVFRKLVMLHWRFLKVHKMVKDYNSEKVPYGVGLWAYIPGLTEIWCSRLAGGHEVHHKKALQVRESSASLVCGLITWHICQSQVVRAWRVPDMTPWALVDHQNR